MQCRFHTKQISADCGCLKWNRPDYGPVERAVIGDIEGQLLIPMVISNIAIEGIMTPEEGAEFLQEEVEKLLEERLE